MQQNQWNPFANPLRNSCLQFPKSPSNLSNFVANINWHFIDWDSPRRFTCSSHNANYICIYIPWFLYGTRMLAIWFPRVSPLRQWHAEFATASNNDRDHARPPIDCCTRSGTRNATIAGTRLFMRGLECAYFLVVCVARSWSCKQTSRCP